MVTLTSGCYNLRLLAGRRFSLNPLSNGGSRVLKNAIRLPVLFALAWVLLMVSPKMHAHESIGSVSNSLLTVNGDSVDYFLNIPAALKATMFSTSELDWYREYFTTTIKLRNADSHCVLSSMSPFSTQDSGNEIVHLNYRCEQPVRSLHISSEAFLDLDDKHVQMLKLVSHSNLRQVLNEGMLNNKQREMHIDNVQQASSLLLNRVWRFLKLGVQHIITGYDHILFVISIILVTAGMRDMLKVVTSFTIAHSITLALAFFGLVSIPASIVEPLIALTIVYVALENLVLKRFKRRWILTFVFGLVHGLGFVGVLQEITMSRNELVSSLVAFNLGIEFGQILIVIPLFWLLKSVREHDWQPQLIRYASLATGVAGMVWFIDRVPFASLFDMVRSSV